MAKKCKTCPFREGSPYTFLAEELGKAAMKTGSRVCHSTGSNAINKNTGKPERLCRGARDIQLALFHRVGFLAEPTDKCWAAKCEELGLK